MSKTIDLNADLGEDESDTGIARDLAMMEVISSCNIASGGHAGSPDNMQKMLNAAKENGVSAGAHPSYPDRKNFGRVSLEISPSELMAVLKLQMDAIKEAAVQSSVSLTHMKPHGALYNDAQDDESLAETIVALARTEGLALVGMAATTLAKKSQQQGVPYIAEAFIDRRYTSASRLVPRSKEGAVIEDETLRLIQAKALSNSEPILSGSGQEIRISAETLCLHSDSDGALQTARAVRRELEQTGISIKSASLG